MPDGKIETNENPKYCSSAENTWKVFESDFCWMECKIFVLYVNNGNGFWFEMIILLLAKEFIENKTIAN